MSMSWLFLSQTHLLENVKNKKEKGRKTIENPFNLKKKSIFLLPSPHFFFTDIFPIKMLKIPTKMWFYTHAPY